MTHPLEGHSSPADSGGTSSTLTKRLAQGAGVIVVSSVMFRFISFWRAAAVVLCDLASTAYYIGAIVEQSIGPAAPWFILAVMCFSYAVRWVYIESCTLFVRGGAYRVVREAMGPLMAKVAVSALMFDHILTGPISSVTAGQYIMGLGVDLLNLFFSTKAADGVVVPLINPTARGTVLMKNWGSVVLACGVTVYFFRENLRGIHESTTKALNIVRVTTVKHIPPGSHEGVPTRVDGAEIDVHDQQLMTAIVDRAERAGKQVKPLIVPTNNPFHAILKTAKDLPANELIIGARNKDTADEQLEQLAIDWISLHDGDPAPLTVRILSRERDMYLDLAGGSRVPKVSERRARSVAELRAGGVGVDRPLAVHVLDAVDAAAIAELAQRGLYDLIVLPLPAESASDPMGRLSEREKSIIQRAHCRVMLVSHPVIPDEVVDRTQAVSGT